MKTFKENIELLKRAGTGCAMVVTKEEKACQTEIIDALIDHSGTIFVFSVASGIKAFEDVENVKIVKGDEKDPMDLMEKIRDFLGSSDNGKGLLGDVLLLPDFAPYMDNPIVRRQMKEAIWSARSEGAFIIMICDKKHDFDDIMNEIKLLEHSLPDRNQTLENLIHMGADQGVTILDEDKEIFCESLSGLTLTSQQDSIAFAILDSKKKGDNPTRIDNQVLMDNKKNEISNRYEFLKVINPDTSFDDVQGLDLIKDWSMLRRRGFTKQADEFGIRCKPKGFLLVGPPGTGKSLTAKSIGSAWGMVLLRFDVGAAFGSLLGQTEENIRTAIEIAERMSPCILWIDEIDQAFGGRGGDTDGGTARRVTGTLLTWLAEKTSSVFVIATANDVSNMPAQMLRKGRFDEIFSVDIPTREERIQIYDYYLRNIKHKVDVSNAADKTDGFVPAEIEAIVNSAHYRAFERDDDEGISNIDILEEIKITVPISKSMKAQFDQMREWANANARPSTSAALKKDAGSKRKLA